MSILVAALATFAVGGPWYSPAVFGGAWLREMQFGEPPRGHPARVFGLAYLCSVIACAVLSGLIGPAASLASGAATGAVVGVGIVATAFGVNYQFANRSWRALLIDGGYHALQFTAFGAILGAWPDG